jgi:hypothetical protein
MPDDELRGLWKRIEAERKERQKIGTEARPEEQLPDEEEEMPAHAPDDDIPNPRTRAFRRWLADKPQAWSIVIATRDALRVLLLAKRKRISRTDAVNVILPMTRAIAISRFAAMYPNREVAVAAAAAAVSAAAAVAPGTVAAAAAAAVAADAAAAADAATAATLVTSAGAIAFADAATTMKDARALQQGRLSPKQLARAALWPEATSGTPARVAGVWQDFAAELEKLDPHWRVWIDWYHYVVLGSPAVPEMSEAWETAFTDLPGWLPWEGGPGVVNTEIARRLKELAGTPQAEAPTELGKPADKDIVLGRLTEVASPQPSITSDGRLDAGPNPTFDVPTADDDLPGLPIRQRTLVKVILSDLPQNAPKYLTTARPGHNGS